MSPTLTIGFLQDTTQLAADFARAGHTTRVISFQDLAQCAEVDLVVFDGIGVEKLEATVEAVAPFTRPKQMFLHTVLERGTQVLDAVEVRQGIVMAAHRLFGDVWVTSAADELGETLVSLLLTEIGGLVLPIDDTVRPLLSATQRLRALERVVRDDAFDLLKTVNPNVEALYEQFANSTPPTLLRRSPDEIDRDSRALTAAGQTGTRRLLVELERRYAQQQHDVDLELFLEQEK